MNLIRDIEKTKFALQRKYAKHNQNAPILRVNNVTLKYSEGIALDNISFELPRAIRLAVVGPNGAGKSTLIKIIAGLLSPDSGDVDVFGEKPGGHICIAYVPQRSQVDWHFPVTVRDVVMMGRLGKLGLLHNPGRSDWIMVDKALDIVKLTDLANRHISGLSGGQQQRMFIARALAQEAELMLMDEPLTGLDFNSQEDILNILTQLSEEGVTVLVALHDLRLASERFDAVMLLNHTLVGLGAPVDVFTNDNLAKAYGLHQITGQINLSMVDDTCCHEEEHENA